MKQIHIILMALLTVALAGSCRKSPASEKREGIPMTIQASVTDRQEDTKTSYTYTSEKALVGSWKEEETITVISFNENGITAVDSFFSTGEEGRKEADFSGTWTGNEGDRIVCLYPSIDTYAGTSIYNNVDVGSPFIVLRNISTASNPLQNNDTKSISDVDLMIGEVEMNGSSFHADLNHLFSVFRVTATIENLPYYSPYSTQYEQAKINTIRISAVDPNESVAPGEDLHERVFVRTSILYMNTYDYSGKPVTDEMGPMEYYLTSAGNDSSFYMPDTSTPVTMTFYVPVRFDDNLQAGLELRFQFGGNYYDDSVGDREQIDVFPAGDKRKVLSSTLPLENGKIYNFTVTI